MDVLTLTATPIPRTLHMSLMGLRDMSVIETPPKDRLAIQTVVAPFSRRLVRSAIELELARGGPGLLRAQPGGVHRLVAAMMQRLVPAARIGVAHGQMGEARTGGRHAAVHAPTSSTSWCAPPSSKTGLDIPRANTIIIDRADRYGLAELYQLRGRVGRSNRRAYAYLLVPPDTELTDIARKRLAAIREFSDLGAGFRIAALDLEIRGAGNMLGGEQHGHINAVGFDLYCRLLEQTVRELQGRGAGGGDLRHHQPQPRHPHPGGVCRRNQPAIAVYKRIASAKSEDQLAALREEIQDRHGPFPEQLENLFAYADLRIQSTRLGIETIDRKKAGAIRPSSPIAARSIRLGC